ncbi:hypothetical protein ACWDUL_20450 [Nocardia niigatensis]
MLSLLEHTIHHGDGRICQLWQVQDRIDIIVADSASGGRRRFAETTTSTLYVAAEPAQQAWANLCEDDLPPLATTSEIAELRASRAKQS